MEWRTIESAPKDETHIWAFTKHGFPQQVAMLWIEGDGYALWVFVDEALRDIEPNPEQPTHWMPLPSPPHTPQDAGRE